MAEPENIVLVYLRRIDEKLDALTIDVRELKDRVTSLELGQAALRRDIAQLAETDARLQAGMDRLREDVGRIRRRLDIVETPTS
jgi:predicted nuclease with TOPRIM domain